MCGIAGLYNKDGQLAETGTVRRMCDVIEHRGPDDDGFFVSGPVGLGMRRLSIIDLDTGKQPIRNEDGTLQVVLNGEIYNYRELRQDLISRGHTFYTGTDTEVIVHLYEEYGEKCVDYLRGMFAFAIWDSRRERLFLARDRIGIKPLYYMETPERILFASELKSILQVPGLEKELDWGAVAHLFAFMTTPKDNSILSGIKKLKPGHTLMAQKGKPTRIDCYWKLKFEANYSQDESYFIDGIRDHLREAVGMRMIADVPLGAFLSGGVDSSAVVAAMAKQSPDPIKTFSIGFMEPEYNEAVYAREVAELYATDHREQILGADTLESLEEFAWFLDEPFGDSSAIPTYMVSKLAAKEVKVALSGDGGDELFAGYDKYFVERQERMRERIPFVIRNMFGAVGRHMPEGAKGRNFLRHLAMNGSERYVHACSLMDREQHMQLFQPAVVEQILGADPWKEMARSLDSEQGHWLSALQHMDIKKYLPLDILTKVDRMSMAASLEARVPLLDHKLVEFAATIPPEMKMHGKQGKHIFKKALRGWLPDNILYRKKQGFAVPLERWFKDDLGDAMREMLLSETSRARNIFNPDYIKKLLDLHHGGRPMPLQLWTLMSFEMWCRRFLDQPSPAERTVEQRVAQFESKSPGLRPSAHTLH